MSLGQGRSHEFPTLCSSTHKVLNPAPSGEGSKTKMQTPKTCCSHPACFMCVHERGGDDDCDNRGVARGLLYNGYFPLRSSGLENISQLNSRLVLAMYACIHEQVDAFIILTTKGSLTFCHVNGCRLNESDTSSPRPMRKPRTLTSMDIPHPAPRRRAVGMYVTKLSSRASAKNAAAARFEMSWYAKCSPISILLGG